MKKLFILSFAVVSSLLFVQCKKTEVLTEEVVSTVKSLSTDQLNGTSWEVLSLDSESNALHLNWEVKYPKLSFNNGILDMKLGRDLCSKEYLNSDNKLNVTTISSCTINNPSHADLYNLFEGQFEISYSLENSDELFVKSEVGTVLKLRKIVSFSTTVNSSAFNIN